MIIVLLLTCLAGRSVAVLLRRPGRGTLVASPALGASPDGLTTGVRSARGPEDDQAWWPTAARSDWTALDEHQLIRLLTDPAS